MKRHLLLLSAMLGAASLAQASTIFFDDALKNGATFWNETGCTANVAPAGEPFAGASPSVKLSMASWAQAGVRINSVISAPNGFIEAQIYRVGGGDLHLRYGSGWTDLTLNAANSDKWKIDGLPGNYAFTSNAWHTLQVNVAALGVTTTVNTIGVKAAGSSSVWYVDNVMQVPEPATIAAAGIGCLALLRRRRKA